MKRRVSHIDVNREWVSRLKRPPNGNILNCISEYWIELLVDSSGYARYSI